MTRLPSLPDPLASLRLGGRSAYADPVTEEEKQDVLSQLGTGALSGLAYVGGMLDKFTGSRALRGLLGGKPRELLSLLPGSDTIGLTDQRDIVSGEDLLGGELDPNAWDANDIAGFGLEVLLDPTLPLTFGAKAALNAGGQAVKKAGLLNRALRQGSRVGDTLSMGPRQAKMHLTLDDVRQMLHGDNAATDALEEAVTSMGAPIRGDEPLGGLVGVGLPFGSPRTTIGGADDFGETIAKGLDAAGRRIRESQPFRAVAEKFAPSMMQTRGVLGQKYAPEIYEATARATGHAMEEIAPIVDEIERLGVFDKSNPNHVENMDWARQLTETNPKNKSQGAVYTDAAGEIQYNLPQDPLMAEAVPHIHKMKEITDTWLQRLHDEGIQIPKLQDVVEYFHRQRNILPGEDLTRRGQKDIFDTFTAGKVSRSEHMKGVTTDKINELSVDPDFSGRAYREGWTDKASDDQLRQMHQDMVKKYGWYGDLGRDISIALKEDSPHKEFLESIAYMDPRRAGGMNGLGEKIPLFRQNPLRDLEAYVQSAARAVEAKQGLMNAIADNIDFTDNIAQRGQSPQTIKSVLSQMGLNVEREGIHRSLAKAIDDNGNAIQVIRDTVDPDYAPGALSTAESTGLRKIFGDNVEGMDPSKQMAIPQEIVQDMKKFWQSHVDPEEVGPLLQAYDKFTQYFKTGLTAIWPAFHTRNAISGQYNNWVAGMGEGNPVKMFEAMRDGYHFARGADEIQGLRSIPGFETMTSDAAATAKLRQEMYAHGVISRQQSQVGETLATLVDDSAQSKMLGRDDLLGEAWGDFKNVFTGGGEAIEGNILNRAGGRIHKAAESTSTLVETTNRAAPYISFRKQGFSPAEAAAKVKAAQVDYKALTPFERSYMRRVMPFYTFTRRQIPFVLENLIENPSGRMAQVIRGTTRLRDQDEAGLMPEHIAQTAAIPMGMAQDGTSQRFLTGLGLSHEDVVNLMRPRRTVMDTLGSTIGGLIGRGNPLVKGAIELAANKSMFSGRELSDLDSPINRTAANLRQLRTGEAPGPMPQPGLHDFILSNSPASRLASTMRTASDPRKGLLTKLLNLGTGMRFTDVDPVKAEQIALRQGLEDLIQGSAGIGRYESLYVRDEDKVTPSDMLKMQVYQALKRQQAEAARVRERTGR